MMTRVFFLVLCMSMVEGISFSAYPSEGCNKIAMGNRGSGFMNMDIPLPKDAMIRRDQKNNTILLLHGENLSEGLDKNRDFRRFRAEKQFADIALAFLSAYHQMFNLISPPDELNVESVKTDHLEMKHVRFKQIFQNVPIWRSEIIVHLNAANQVCRVEGRYIPTPENTDIQPVLSHEDAFHKVAEHMKIKENICPHCQSELVIFALSPEKAPCLAYRVLTKPNLIEGWLFFIDAKTGNILEKISTIQTELLDIG